MYNQVIQQLVAQRGNVREATTARLFAVAFRAAEIILALPEGLTFDAHSDELDGIAEDTPPAPAGR